MNAVFHAVNSDQTTPSKCVGVH